MRHESRYRRWSISSQKRTSRKRSSTARSPSSSKGKLKVGKVNSDEQPELAQAFNVMSIPAFFILKDGKVVDQMVGGMPKAMLKGRIDAQL